MVPLIIGDAKEACIKSSRTRPEPPWDVTFGVSIAMVSNGEDIHNTYIYYIVIDAVCVIPSQASSMPSHVRSKCRAEVLHLFLCQFSSASDAFARLRADHPWSSRCASFHDRRLGDTLGYLIGFGCEPFKVGSLQDLVPPWLARDVSRCKVGLHASQGLTPLEPGEQTVSHLSRDQRGQKKEPTSRCWCDSPPPLSQCCKLLWSTVLMMTIVW